MLLQMGRAMASRQIEDVFVALETLPKGQDWAPAANAYLREFITWDLSEQVAASEVVIRRLLKSMKIESHYGVAVDILKSQPAVAVPVAVEILLNEQAKLTREECKQIWEKMEATKPKKELKKEKSVEYSKRIAANCTILRISGTPKTLLKSTLLGALGILSHSNLPMEYLTELAILAPYHPLLEAAELLDPPLVSLSPLVTSTSFRCHVAIDEFNSFIHLFRKVDALSMFNVVVRICERLEQIEMLESGDIDRMVDFWMSAIQIFEGVGIDMSHIQKGAQLIEKTAMRFDVPSRPLFLKHFLRKVGAIEENRNPLEPQIVAVIITVYKQNMTSLRAPEFYDELGDFWTLCFALKYDDIHSATVYYSSLFALAHAQALFQINKTLCRAVYEKILRPIYDQIVDYKKMKSIEKSPMELGAEVFDMLVFNYLQAEGAILKFI